MKVFGQQTTTDILPGCFVPHLTGGMVILVSKKNKYTFLYNKILLKMLHNILIIFDMQNDQICVVNPVLIF